MTTSTASTILSTQSTETQQPAVSADLPADDFFSDAPLAACPLRKDGMGEGEICEACQ